MSVVNVNLLEKLQVCSSGSRRKIPWRSLRANRCITGNETSFDNSLNGYFIDANQLHIHSMFFVLPFETGILASFFVLKQDFSQMRLRQDFSAYLTVSAIRCLGGWLLSLSNVLPDKRLWQEPIYHAGRRACCWSALCVCERVSVWCGCPRIKCLVLLLMMIKVYDENLRWKSVSLSLWLDSKPHLISFRRNNCIGSFMSNLKLFCLDKPYFIICFNSCEIQHILVYFFVIVFVFEGNKVKNKAKCIQYNILFCPIDMRPHLKKKKRAPKL